jgi:hypothetical protein
MATTLLAGCTRAIVEWRTPRCPAPPVDADDTYAVDQTVTAPLSGWMRRTPTLAAQIGDVRLSATWLHDGTPETTPDVAPDTQALDGRFTDGVQKVRRVGGP